MNNGRIYVCIERPEGYEDVHRDLVLADARIGFPYEDVTEEVTALEVQLAAAQTENARLRTAFEGSERAVNHWMAEANREHNRVEKLLDKIHGAICDADGVSS